MEMIRPQTVAEKDRPKSWAPDLHLNTSEVITQAKLEGKDGSWQSSLMQLSVKEPPYYWMYDSAGMARQIAASGTTVALAVGLTATCPLCDGFHPESEWNPNACPAKPHVATKSCPVCAEHGSERVLYDLPAPKGWQAATWAAGAERRLQTAYEAHVAVFHPATARSMGLGVCQVCGQSSSHSLNGTLYCKEHAIEALNEESDSQA